MLFLFLIFERLISSPTTWRAIQNIPRLERPRADAVRGATDAIIRQVHALQISEKRGDDLFYNFYGLRANNYNVLPTIFWQPLEERLGVKSTKVTFKGTYQIAHDDYLFLFCAHRDVFNNSIYSEKDCTDYFKKDKAQYIIVSDIYKNEHLSVFLAKKAGHDGLK